MRSSLKRLWNSAKRPSGRGGSRFSRLYLLLKRVEGRVEESRNNGLMAVFALLLRQKIEIELPAGTGVDDFGKVAGNVIRVAAIALGKSEG